MSFPDPTGRLITELRDDPDVRCDRIKAGQPIGDTVVAGQTVQGWVRPAGEYVRFVLLVRLGFSRGNPHCPTQEVRYSAKCYGTNEQDAAALAGEVSTSLHDRGRRITASGISIFNSLDDGGGGVAYDPKNGQPYESVVIAVSALTETLPIA